MSPLKSLCAAAVTALALATPKPLFAESLMLEGMSPQAPVASAKPANSPETVLGYVNGTPLTQGALDALDRDLGPFLTVQGPERASYLFDELIKMTLVVQLAQRQGLDKDPAFARRFDYARTTLLDREILDKVAASAAIEAQSRFVAALRKTAKIERFSPPEKK